MGEDWSPAKVAREVTCEVMLEVENHSDLVTIS